MCHEKWTVSPVSGHARFLKQEKFTRMNSCMSIVRQPSPLGSAFPPFTSSQNRWPPTAPRDLWTRTNWHMYSGKKDQSTKYYEGWKQRNKESVETIYYSYKANVREKHRACNFSKIALLMHIQYTHRLFWQNFTFVKKNFINKHRLIFSSEVQVLEDFTKNSIKAVWEEEKTKIKIIGRWELNSDMFLSCVCTRTDVFGFVKPSDSRAKWILDWTCWHLVMRE